MALTLIAIHLHSIILHLPGMNSRLFNWTILIVLAFIWGSSFILMKKGMEALSSDQVAAMRMLFAFLFVTPFMIKYAKASDLKNWKAFMAIGITGNFIPAFLFTLAETRISSALAGMLNGLTPFFTLLMGWVLFRSKTKWVNVLGLFIGLIGAIILLIPSDSNLDLSSLEYGGYVVIATILYGTSVNLIRNHAGNYHAITTACWSFTFVGPLGGIYMLFTDWSTPAAHPAFWSSIGYTSLLALGGTSISIMLFNQLVKNTGTLFSSSVTYLIPVVAIMWGLFAGEVITSLQITAIFIILSGVYLVNKK